MPDAAEPGVMPGFENRLLSGSGVVLRTLFPLGATLAIATISFAALRAVFPFGFLSRKPPRGVGIFPGGRRFLAKFPETRLSTGSQISEEFPEMYRYPRANLKGI